MATTLAEVVVVIEFCGVFPPVRGRTPVQGVCGFLALALASANAIASAFWKS
jgi:hypothetical protein